MKLYKDYGTGSQASIDLPNDLIWKDEFTWVPAVQTRTYSLTGALIIETALKQAGRPISLEAATDMGWVPRSTVVALRAWAALQNILFKLVLEYPDDTRMFNVMFDQEGQNAIAAEPVKGFPGHSPEDWFTIKLKLIEV